MADEDVAGMLTSEEGPDGALSEAAERVESHGKGTAPSGGEAGGEESQPGQAPKRRIRRLEEAVVNRIAAGEIIQRPANAIKEMLENSLDAGSTAITITVKNGGLKLLQIQDNGHGINKEDMDIVCERFTTSKLVNFEDLGNIHTYGFRGEALASISHVAHVTITTKTATDPCAYRARYSDGKLIPEKPGQPAVPKACAGNKGTVITVEDLFYNVPTRRKALTSASEEHSKITNVVAKYAIHNSGVAFTLKKQGMPTADVNTLTGASKVDNIRAIYGSAVANELIEISAQNEELKFKLDGYISNANYSMKKQVFLLFINHRLVHSTSIKKALDQVYSAYLPKNSFCFAYMSLVIHPMNVDVNVHPTKHEVHFLNESEIVEAIAAVISAKLQGANSSRTFFTQALLPGASLPTLASSHSSSSSTMSSQAGHVASSSQQQSQRATPEEIAAAAAKRTARSKTGEAGPRIYDHDLVRIDSRSQTLDKFLSQPSQSQGGGCLTKKASTASAASAAGDEPATEEQAEESEDEWDPIRMKYRKKKKRAPSPPPAPEEEGAEGGDADAAEVIDVDAVADSSAAGWSSARGASAWAPSNTPLTSVLQLRQALKDREHATMRDLLREHKFVGCITPEMSLVQYATKLYLVKTQDMARELFYQLVLRGFGAFASITFNPPPSLVALLTIALDNPESGWSPADGPKEELVAYMSDFLQGKGDMLAEYFSMKIDESGRLTAIPVLLDKYIPRMSGLPMFLLRLATEVNWEEEKACFQTVATEIAKFYQYHQAEALQRDEQEDVDEETGEPAAKRPANDGWKWTIEHVIFPALRFMFNPPKALAEKGGVMQVADLKDLYKVFERC